MGDLLSVLPVATRFDYPTSTVATLVFSHFCQLLIYIRFFDSTGMCDFFGSSSSLTVSTEHRRWHVLDFLRQALGSRSTAQVEKLELLCRSSKWRHRPKPHKVTRPTELWVNHWHPLIRNWKRQRHFSWKKYRHVRSAGSPSKLSYHTSELWTNVYS